MPPFNNKQKRIEDKRSSNEIAIDSAKTSTYNMCTPMYKAEHIRLRNPITGLDKLYSVTDPAFYEAFYELSQLGLKKKLFDELESFIANIDPDWQSVYADIVQYFEGMDASNEESQDSSIS